MMNRHCLRNFNALLLALIGFAFSSCSGTHRLSRTDYNKEWKAETIGALAMTVDLPPGVFDAGVAHQTWPFDTGRRFYSFCAGRLHSDVPAMMELPHLFHFMIQRFDQAEWDQFTRQGRSNSLGQYQDEVAARRFTPVMQKNRRSPQGSAEVNGWVYRKDLRCANGDIITALAFYRDDLEPDPASRQRDEANIKRVLLSVKDLR